MEISSKVSATMSSREMAQLRNNVSMFNTKLETAQNGVTSKNELDESDFMKLMITQLKTQDPTKPMDDKEFIGQIAQFNSMKQMNKLTDGMDTLAKEFSFTRAVSLVNKKVTWAGNDGVFHQGAVDSIKIREGKTFLNISGSEINIEDVQEVSSVTAEPEPIH